MAYRSPQYKDVPYKMIVRNFFNGIENNPQGIETTSKKKQLHSQVGGLLYQIFEIEHDQPPHGQVEQQRNGLEPARKKELQNRSYESDAPYRIKNGPSVSTFQGNEDQGGIGTCDQKVDADVVHYPESFSKMDFGNRVVYGGGQEQDNDAQAIDDDARGSIGGLVRVLLQ